MVLKATDTHMMMMSYTHYLIFSGRKNSVKIRSTRPTNYLLEYGRNLWKLLSVCIFLNLFISLSLSLCLSLSFSLTHTLFTTLSPSLSLWVWQTEGDRGHLWRFARIQNMLLIIVAHFSSKYKHQGAALREDIKWACNTRLWGVWSFEVSVYEWGGDWVSVSV